MDLAMDNFFGALFVLFFSLASLQGEEAIVSFADLERGLNILDEKQVKIRGFLYQQPTGTLILASQPNLKSCCVGVKARMPQQVIVRGENPLDPSPYAITLGGVLKKELQYDQTGEPVPIYVLDQAWLVQEHSYFLWIMAIALALLTQTKLRMRIFDFIN